MKHLVLGTAGHIDHGKSSLVLALTGIDPDRLKEEKERGITIELGFAHLDLPSGDRLGIVDVPGHERFVRTMVAGVTGVDLVALVIAADEGVMPQTREHLDICRVLGLQHGLIVLSKVDLVSEEWLELVRADVAEFVRGTFLEQAPVIACSVKDGRGLAELRAALADLAGRISGRTSEGTFRLPVDRVFTMKGFGTVVTGTTVEGSVRVGDELVALPGGARGRVRGIQVHGGDVETVHAGNRTAINLQGVGLDEIRRGEVLGHPGALRTTYMIDVRLQYLASAPRPLKVRERVRFHVGTSEILARAIPLEAEEIPPGGGGFVQLRLEEPAVCMPGDRFVLRSYSPIVTVGGGAVVNPFAPKHRRPYDAAVRALAGLDAKDDSQRAVALVRAAGREGITLGDLRTFLRLSEKRANELVGGLLSRRLVVRFARDEDRLVAPEVYDALRESLAAQLAGYHAREPKLPGMPKAELEERAGRGHPATLVARALESLAAEGRVVLEKDIVRLSTHRVVLAEQERAVEEAVLADYLAAGLQPPTLRETMEKHAGENVDVEGLVRRLAAEGKLVALQPTLFLAAEHLSCLKVQLADYFAQHERLDAQAFKNLTGLSRKFAIPILEYLDKDKFTVRVGDARVLRKRQGGGQ